MNQDEKQRLLENSFSEAIKIAKDLIRFSLIFGENGQKEAQLYIQQYLNEKGWKTYLDVFGFKDLKNQELINQPWEYDPRYSSYSDKLKTNLYAVIDSNKPGPTLILNGHIDVDVVDNKNEWSESNGWKAGEVRGEKLIGRGATDMLGGLSSFLVIKNLLDQITWNGKVIVTSVVDEEIGGNGSIRCCEWLEERKILDGNVECIIGEPTDNQICNSCYGFLPFFIRKKGKVHHMNTVNYNLSHIAFLKKLLSEMEILVKKNPEIFLNIGYIHGGTEPSLPINDLHIKGIISMPPGIDLDDLKKQISIASDNNVNFPKLQIPSVKLRNSFFSSIESNVFNSGCDAFIFNSFKIPTVVFGPGKLAQAHSTNEFVLLEDINIYLKKLFDLTMRFFNDLS